jgi:hypothetical protein
MQNLVGWTWMRRLWNRVLPSIVQEVPDELAVCEFMCSKPHCHLSDWDTCTLRRAVQNGDLAGDASDLSVRERVLLINVGRRRDKRPAVNE